MPHGHALIDFGPLEEDRERDAFVAMASLSGSTRRVLIARSTLMELAKGSGKPPAEIFEQNRDIISVRAAELWEVGTKDEPIVLNGFNI